MLVSKLFLLLSVWLGVMTKVDGQRFVAYIDSLTGWWDKSILAAWGVPGYTKYSHPYNVLILSFYLSDGSVADGLSPWVDPLANFGTSTLKTICNCSNPTADSFRQGLINIYHAHGIKLLMSCFGSTDFPTSTYDATTLGNSIATFVKQYKLDGVDIDWEDSGAFESGTGLGENWLTNLTIAIRAGLPKNDGYIITHAPQAPYFGGKALYSKGAYLTFHKNAGTLINWYNLQFYNQGSSSYLTFSTLFQSANGWSSNTSVYQMVNGFNDMNIKIPAQMVVVGKPCTSADVSNTGYVAPATLASIFSQAISNQNVPWSAGFMIWQFSSDAGLNFTFGNTVAASFSGVTPSPTITSSPTLAPTPAPTSAPTSAPTLAPTLAPTPAPTLSPTLSPNTASNADFSSTQSSSSGVNSSQGSDAVSRSSLGVFFSIVFSFFFLPNFFL